ncbi:hypothetical protein ANRL2_01638 [Anaerolineae bacterium]|nr:hypothetical protein ANRL2_01638 [Anaerolineae bacterium]
MNSDVREAIGNYHISSRQRAVSDAQPSIDGPAVVRITQPDSGTMTMERHFTTMDGFETIFLFTDVADGLLNKFKGEIPVGAAAVLLGPGALFLALLLLKRRGRFALRLLFAGMFLIFWGANWFTIHSNDYARFDQEFRKLQSVYTHQQYQVAEGYVHVLHMQPANGHDQGDVVNIGGVEFEIDAYMLTFGYAHIIAHGGALKEGIYARVYYYRDESLSYRPMTILRVDLKDHAGS